MSIKINSGLKPEIRWQYAPEYMHTVTILPRLLSHKMVTLKIKSNAYGRKFMWEGSVPSEQYKSCNLIMYRGACYVLLFCLLAVLYHSILNLQLGTAQLPYQ